MRVGKFFPNPLNPRRNQKKVVLWESLTLIFLGFSLIFLLHSIHSCGRVEYSPLKESFEGYRELYKEPMEVRDWRYWENRRRHKIMLEEEKSEHQGLQRWGSVLYLEHMKYTAILPFIDDMGSINPIVCSHSSSESKWENLLWEINSMRRHDGLREWDLEKFRGEFQGSVRWVAEQE